MAKYRWSLAVAVVAAAGAQTLLASCATLRQAVQTPTLRFDRADLSAISLGGVTLDVVFDVDNPNSFSLSVDQVQAALFVEGKQLVATKPPKGVRLRAKGVTKLVLPMEIRFAEVASTIAHFLSKDQATYRLEGAIGVATPLGGMVQVPLAAEGRFDVPKLPEIALGTPAVRELSTTGATIDLPLVITNTNALPLPIQGLEAALKIDGVRAASFSLDQLGSIGAKASKSVTVPLSFRLDQSLALAAAIRRGRARVELAGEITSGPAEVPMVVAEMLELRR